MDADIRGDAAGFFLLPLPGDVIPDAPAGDVRQYHLMLPAALIGL